MAGGLGRRVGGITRLLTLIDEHQEALEYDLIAMGFRLRDAGTRRLPWRDLIVIVRGILATTPPGSALIRAINEHHIWTPEFQMQAQLVNELRLLRYDYERVNMRTPPPPPDLIRPPWEPTPESDGRDVIRGDSFESAADAADWYAARFPERAAEVRALTGGTTP